MIIQGRFIDLLKYMGSVYGKAKSLIDLIMLEVIKHEAIKESRDACEIVPAGLSENIGNGLTGAPVSQ